MSWPAYASVAAADYEVRSDPDVRRTALEDGAVRQERTATAALTRRLVKVHLSSDADRIRFQAWAAANAHTWTEWTDPDDGVGRRVRVRGGVGAISYRAVVSRAGQRRWEATLELEGLWSDVVPDANG